MNLTGAVLAGGQSRRMGRDKALLEINGKPFVRHVADILAALCSPVVIIGIGPERFETPGYRLFDDLVPQCGPLGGIHSALSHSSTENVLIAACDLPLISVEAIRYLLQQRTADKEISIVHHGTFVQPLLGVYARRCLPTLESFLENGGRKVWEFLNECSMETIDLRKAPFDLSENILMNVNTPEEYEKIRDLDRSTRGGSNH